MLELNREGRYGFLLRPEVEIAARRFTREGFVRVSLRWLGIELHRLFLGEIRTRPFPYLDGGGGTPGPPPG